MLLTERNPMHRGVLAAMVQSDIEAVAAVALDTLERYEALVRALNAQGITEVPDAGEIISLHALEARRQKALKLKGKKS
jgi:hypothetical protein